MKAQWNVLSKVVVAGLLAVTACTQKSKDNQTKTVVITVKAQMESEELAQAGEQLISPTTFHLADKVFDMVLQKDPKNTKALLYKSALKPWMVFKGILARVRPIVVKHADEAKYVEFLRNDLRESPIKSWLLDGPEDITKASQIQDVLVKFRDASEEFRKFLIAHPDLDLTIYLNEFVFKASIERRQNEECRVLENSPDNMTVECDRNELAQVKMNSADVIMLRQLVAAQVLYANLYSNYSVDGVENVLKTLGDIDRLGETTGDPRTQEKKLAVLSSVKGFGLLRKDNGFKVVRQIGADLKGALEWAMKFQAEICPMGQPTRLNRKGYIFEEGVCFQGDEAKGSYTYMMTMLTEALSAEGKTTVEGKLADGSLHKFVIRPFAVTDQPAQDLRSIMPAKYDRCGNAVEYRDATLGGLYPNGDANLTLKSNCNR